MNKQCRICCLSLVSLTVVFPVRAELVKSGYEYLTPEMQAMQDDDFGNPGMIVVDQGAALFIQPDGEGKSCGSCHGEDGSKLDTKQLARYPVYNEQLKQPLTLRQRIILCRNTRLNVPALEYADQEALQLEAFVRHLAHGETVDVDVSGPLAPYYRAGETLFRSRYGQVDIACHQCHDYHAGKNFRGQVLTQGQTNGLPAYRFTEGQVAGTHERFTQCLSKLRAEPYAPGSDEYVNLEVYMNARSNGLKIETPAIRY